MRKYCKIAEDCLDLALKAGEQRHRLAFLDMASMLLERAGNDAKTALLKAEVEALKGPAN